MASHTGIIDLMNLTLRRYRDIRRALREILDARTEQAKAARDSKTT